MDLKISLYHFNWTAWNLLYFFIYLFKSWNIWYTLSWGGVSSQIGCIVFQWQHKLCKFSTFTSKIALIGRNSVGIVVMSLVVRISGWKMIIFQKMYKITSFYCQTCFELKPRILFNCFFQPLNHPLLPLCVLIPNHLEVGKWPKLREMMVFLTEIKPNWPWLEHW